MQKKILFYIVASVLLPTFLLAQNRNKAKVEQCGTMQKLDIMFEHNPELKAKFEQERTRFNSIAKQRYGAASARTAGDNERTVAVIPIVFHIVATNPAYVTDAQIQAEMDTLNKDFSGTNGDSTAIPSYFKPLFGKSGIQFCLAKQTPDGNLTSGIERVTTTQASFSINNENVKHTAQGGADSWDNTKYYNVWVCTLSGGILGYSPFPATGNADDQGTTIDYRTLPGSSLNHYNKGKTLSHETGHYFNLYHTWGDDDGACTGSDFIDDTPNQANSSSGLDTTGIVRDSCTPGGNGIMYQNYMDYTDDEDLVMFTTEQVSRMESALVTYRSSLLSSKGCSLPVLRNYNAQIVSIDQPGQRICSNTFTPSVTIRNRGIQTLTSLVISSKIDNGPIVTYNYTGSLNTVATASLPITGLTTDTGFHTLTVFVSNPNNTADEDRSDDTLTISYQYFAPVTVVKESFEGAAFPPVKWDILNPDGAQTWQRATGVAKTGNASAFIKNYEYNSVGQQDDLRMPTVNLTGVDSAFVSFQVAAATYTNIGTTGNSWDTLEVLVSNDCGANYTSLYKKYASTLVTRTAPTTTSFVPTADEWRKDSVNLTGYVDQPNVLLTFRNTTGFENNIYLDDINLRTVIINPNLKAQGILITPNPTSGLITVQFYPQPTNLRAIQVYNVAGQKVAEINVSGNAVNLYTIDISRYASGMYIVNAIYNDRRVTRKILKF